MAAAFFAAALAWQLNFLLTYWPGRLLFFLAPLQEEAVKTIPAIYIGVPIFFTHIFFGVAEATWEIFSHQRNGIYAGLVAMASHSAFGFIAAWAYSFFNTVLSAVFAGYLAHLVWNFMVKILVSRRRKI